MKFSLIALAGLTSTVAAQFQGASNQGYPGAGIQYQGNYQQPSYRAAAPPASHGAWPNLPQHEIADWQGCTNVLLNAFNDKVQGSGPACDMWKCLHVQAGKYGRGGALTSLSNVLNPICGLNSAFNVFNW